MYFSQLSLDNVCEDTPTIVFTNDYFTAYGGMTHGRILKPIVIQDHRPYPLQDKIYHHNLVTIQTFTF